jgi:hypothetical protein
MGMKTMLTSLVVMGSALACGFGATEPEVQEDIVGVWVWVSSTGGIAGTTRTPATEGFTQTLRIAADGEVELFRDGVSEVRTSYTFFVGPEGSSTHLAFAEPLFDFDSAIVGVTPGDTLVLIDPCCDGFERRWVR